MRVDQRENMKCTKKNLDLFYYYFYQILTVTSLLEDFLLTIRIEPFVPKN